MKAWGILLGLAMGIAGSAPVHADSATQKELLRSCLANARTECERWAFAGGGNEFPRGLTTDNTVELAHGERYMLTGAVAIFSNKVWFNIDFDEQPWLASQKRRANPFYRLDDDMTRWKRYNGQTLTLIVTAQNVIWQSTDDKYSVETLLVPGSDPIVKDSVRRLRDMWQTAACR